MNTSWPKPGANPIALSPRREHGGGPPASAGRVTATSGDSIARLARSSHGEANPLPEEWPHDEQPQHHVGEGPGQRRVRGGGPGGEQRLEQGPVEQGSAGPAADPDGEEDPGEERRQEENRERVDTE